MREFLRRSGILLWVVVAIIAAVALGPIRVDGAHLVPVGIGRVFATFSSVFSQFLSFSIPLIIIGLVTPAIADLGRGAGKWLGATTAIAYGSTIFSGALTYGVCASVFPALLASTTLGEAKEPGSALETYSTIEMPAPVPVTLRQAKRNGVSEAVASFTVPLCATIHLAGSTSEIFSFAFAIVLTQGVETSPAQWIGFIFMLGITMVAAPGVPGGAIMAATGLLSSMLGFDEAQVGLMIATYIALDSFGTATNVTGDGAIAMVVDRLAGGTIGDEGDPENARELAFDGMAYLDRLAVEGVVSPEDLADSAARNGSGARPPASGRAD